MINEVLALLREKISYARFCEAFSSAPQSHLLDGITVTVEIDSETHGAERDEVKLAFYIHLAGAELSEAERAFTDICKALGGQYRNIKSVSRSTVKKDAKTGAMIVPCFVTLENTVEGNRMLIKINGEEYYVRNVKTSFSSSARSITSFGEDEPYASISEGVIYTVTLYGIESTGLTKLSGFTVGICDDSGDYYQNCAWKSISGADKTAVFTSSTVTGERRI